MVFFFLVLKNNMDLHLQIPLNSVLAFQYHFADSLLVVLQNLFFFFLESENTLLQSQIPRLSCCIKSIMNFTMTKQQLKGNTKFTDNTKATTSCQLKISYI